MSLQDQNKKRNLFKIIFIQITITLILLVLIDLIANLFIDRVGHKEFRLQRPEPYANASYFSKDFINESFTQPGKWLLDEKYGGVKPDNYKGKWINVKNNRRVTINEQKDYLGKIYIFGGSTVYNGEVPDDLTIASQLAGIGANNLSYKVMNMGATSVHSTQQLGRLQSEINLKKNDIVIFYDGLTMFYKELLRKSWRVHDRSA